MSSWFDDDSLDECWFWPLSDSLSLFDWESSVVCRGCWGVRVVVCSSSKVVAFGEAVFVSLAWMVGLLPGMILDMNCGGR